MILSFVIEEDGMLMETGASKMLEGLGRIGANATIFKRQFTGDLHATNHSICIFKGRGEVKLDFILARAAFMMNTLDLEASLFEPGKKLVTVVATLIQRRNSAIAGLISWFEFVLLHEIEFEFAEHKDLGETHLCSLFNNASKDTTRVAGVNLTIRSMRHANDFGIRFIRHSENHSVRIWEKSKITVRELREARDRRSININTIVADGGVLNQKLIA